MIWTSNSFLQPAGNQISIVYFDGYFYKMFRADFDNWVYYAFVSEIDQHNGNLKIHDFINYMVSTGHLNLSCIDLIRCQLFPEPFCL